MAESKSAALPLGYIPTRLKSRRGVRRKWRPAATRRTIVICRRFEQRKDGWLPPGNSVALDGELWTKSPSIENPAFTACCSYLPASRGRCATVEYDRLQRCTHVAITRVFRSGGNALDRKKMDKPLVQADGRAERSAAW